MTLLFQKAYFRESKHFDIDKNSLLTIYKKAIIDLNKQSFKKKFFAFLNISRLWKKILPLVFWILFLNG